MRCAGCGRNLSDNEVVYIKGTAGCYACFKRGEAIGRWMLPLMFLILSILFGAMFGLLIWDHPEIIGR